MKVTIKSKSVMAFRSPEASVRVFCLPTAVELLRTLIMVHVVSYDLQRKHCIFERRVEVIIGFDTGDPSGCTQSNQRLLFPVFKMLILDDGSRQTISLASRIILFSFRFF